MAGAPIRSDELLATACFRGEVDRVRDMLDHGAATNARGEHMTSALHWAISMGHIEVAEVRTRKKAGKIIACTTRGPVSWQNPPIRWLRARTVSSLFPRTARPHVMLP